MPGSTVTARLAIPNGAGASIGMILPAVFAVGFSSILTQLVLMREMLEAFSGSELVLGIVLGNWLLSMGLGALVGRFHFVLKRITWVLPAIMILTAVLPPVLVFLLRGLREFVFLRGTTLGLLEIWIASLVVLLPYCVATGCFLTLASSLTPGLQFNGPGRVYAMDCVGSVFGGVIFSFILVRYLDHWTILWLPGSVNIIVVCMAFSHPAFGLLLPEGKGLLRDGKKWLVFAFALSAISLFFIVRYSPDKLTTAMQFPGQNLVFAGNSPYGHLVVTESDGQTNFLESGLLVASCPNIEQAEESVHYAMAQRPDAKNVLLIGGLLSGAVSELIKYEVAEIDCVELDPLVARMAREFIPGAFSSRKIRIIEGDARQFLIRVSNRYDVIIMVLPDPSTIQINRFYTAEFFRDVKNSLFFQGVFSFALGHYENVMTPALAQMLGCAERTLTGVFVNRLIIPGQRNYFLASDGYVTNDIAERLDSGGIKTHFVNRHYLKTVFAPDRVGDMQRALQSALLEHAPMNEDFKPILCYLQLRHWASQFNRVPLWIAVGLVLILAFYMLKLKGVYWIVFASGFAGSAMEILLLLVIQVLVGSVYRNVGMVVAVFMAGLAAGAYGASHWLDRSNRNREIAMEQSETSFRSILSHNKTLLLLSLVIAIVCLALPWLIRYFVPGFSNNLERMPILAFVCLYAFCLSFAVGAQFPIACQSQARHSVSRLFAADFIGASIGALLTGAFLAPLLGVASVCLISGLLNLMAMLLLLFKGKYEQV